ncbi:MAG: hypothetical protein IKB60_05680 [Clostridia bacterium]|nr:hypothetical protein [Clostridia bacterium]
MVYADYTFYKDEYCGTYVGEEDFSHLVLLAGAKMRAFLNCEPEEGDITDEFKFAVCEICDLLLASLNHSGIEYERNDGYWVSYEDEEKTDARIKSCIKTWLKGSELLYRGRRGC